MFRKLVTWGVTPLGSPGFLGDEPSVSQPPDGLARQSSFLPVSGTLPREAGYDRQSLRRHDPRNLLK